MGVPVPMVVLLTGDRRIRMGEEEGFREKGAKPYSDKTKV